MCKAMGDMRYKAACEAAELRSVEIATRLIAQGKLSFEEIAEVAELTTEKVKELAEQRSA